MLTEVTSLAFLSPNVLVSGSADGSTAFERRAQPIVHVFKRTQAYKYDENFTGNRDLSQPGITNVNFYLDAFRDLFSVVSRDLYLEIIL